LFQLAEAVVARIKEWEQNDAGQHHFDPPEELLFAGLVQGHCVLGFVGSGISPPTRQ
jgi:hypothetical protein